MSFRLVADVLERPTDTPAEKLLLIIIASYADDDGKNIFPSKKTLAAKTCLDERTVQRLCTKLVGMTVLEVVSESIGRPTVYRLHVDNMKLTNPRQDATPGVTPPRQDATLPPASGHPSPGVTPPPPGTTPPNSVITQPVTHPADSCKDSVRETKGKKKAPPIDPREAACEATKDWPIIHVKDGDFCVAMPYDAEPRIREAITEWLAGRLRNPKAKGLPTVFGMKRDATGWWDRYPLGAVVYAVEKAASKEWIGLIEEVAKEWKQAPTGTPSLQDSGIMNGVQKMKAMMDQRQAAIKRKAAGAIEHEEQQALGTRR